MPQVIRDLMVSDVVTIDPSTSVVDAARQMIQQERRGSSLSWKGKAHGHGNRPRYRRARGCRGRRPEFDDGGRHRLARARHRLARTGCVVEEARRQMAQHELDRVLDVEGDRLVGIISEADIRSDEAPMA